MNDGRFQDRELERRLGIWRDYMMGTGKNPLGFGLSALLRMAMGGFRDSRVPILIGEATDIDGEIERLPYRYRLALKLEYLWPELTQEQRAQRQAVSVRTFLRNVEEAKRQLRALLDDLYRRRSGTTKAPQQPIERCVGC
jgi:hypothetical protein